MACGVALVINTAWLSDDAYITLRTIDNFWRGYGLRWNVIERVQSYTHPLWMLLVGSTYGLTRAPYATVMGLSLLCTLGTLVIVPHIARTRAAAFAVLVVMISSRPFIEFSTSGLENPLSHLLLALFVWQYLEIASPANEQPPVNEHRPATIAHDMSRLAVLSLLGGLAAVNRLDSVWLTAPAIVAATWSMRSRKAMIAALAGAVPLLAWEAFALFYYGFALPNTAYAKLATGIPAQALLHQGTRYLIDSMLTDLITLPVIGIAIVSTVFAGRNFIPIGIGLIASLCSIAAVGGDFMSGRFLSPPFVMAALVLCRRMPIDAPPRAAVVAVAAIILSVWSPQSPWRVWRHPQAGQPIMSRGGYGIVDERAVYYPFTGLIPVIAGGDPARHPWAQAGRSSSAAPRVMVYEAVGLLGFYAGPGVHIIDPMALTDPLLARLPAEPGWRIGHFKRRVPDGYVATLEQCLAATFPHARVVPSSVSCVALPASVNAIQDRGTALLYDRLAVLTQGRLFDVDRLRAIAGARLTSP
jgi:arabinofuranosyltransferase